jgi:hypothetical protein
MSSVLNSLFCVVLPCVARGLAVVQHPVQRALLQI